MYVDFGVHDVVTPGFLDVESGYSSSAESCDIHPVQAQTVGRLLSEVANTCVEAWGTEEETNHKGLVFLQASRLVQKIGDGVKGNDDVKVTSFAIEIVCSHFSRARIFYFAWLEHFVA